MQADIRHGLRALSRNRTFSIVATLVLASSVAVSTLIFCMLEGVVLKPLPYAHPERLVRLYDVGDSTPKFPMAIGRYLDYRGSAKSLESIALYTGQDRELSAADGGAQQLTGVAISAGFFDVLRTKLFLGRAFTDADLRRGLRQVVISFGLWRERFHSDPAILGKSIRLDREPWTIIGVAPAGFQHVGGDYRSPLQGESVDIWLPLTLDGNDRALRAFHYCNAIARVRDGYTEQQARKEVEGLAANYTARYPKYGQWRARMEPLLSEVTGRSSQIVWLLSAAGGLVLLVACANIAGLCVARAVARRRELSLRHALGANRWQLLRVGLAENLILGSAGALLGLAFAAIGLPLLRQLLPADFPRIHEIALTPLGALFAASIALGISLVAGLFPASGARAIEANQRSSSGRDSRRLRTVLVAGEVALAGLLSAGALFLLRSYQEIGARDHGFNSSATLTFQLTVPGGSRSKPGDVGRLYDEIRRKILEIPGVASAGATTNLPWSGYDENSGFAVAGRPSADFDGSSARYQAASVGYFEAAGMRLVSGRLFDEAREARGQPLGVIINDALAARYFPRQDAVGAMATIWNEDRRVLGVVKSIKDFPADLAAEAGFWFPLTQVEFNNVFFAVRLKTGEPTTLRDAVRAAVHAVDPELALANIRTLEQRANAALASRKFALWLFQAFALLALVLAATGIYGLLAYIVQQRRKELGIRLALGATRTGLAALVVSDGLKMALAGAVCCLLLIPVGGIALRKFLFNVEAFDLLTMTGAPAALLLIAFFASLSPALAAARSDPAISLRDDDVMF